MKLAQVRYCACGTYHTRYSLFVHRLTCHDEPGLSHGSAGWRPAIGTRIAGSVSPDHTTRAYSRAAGFKIWGRNCVQYAGTYVIVVQVCTKYRNVWAAKGIAETTQHGNSEFILNPSPALRQSSDRAHEPSPHHQRGAEGCGAGFFLVAAGGALRASCFGGRPRSPRRPDFAT